MSTVPPVPQVPTAMNPALALLYHAYECARECRRPPWDFAVEIEAVRCLGLTTTDLRWLVCQGLVEHARDTTRPGRMTRSFRDPGGLTFSPHTCLVLTEVGARAVRTSGAARVGGLGTGDRTLAQGCPLPCWDRRRRELYLGNRLIKCFKQPAPSQELILTAFEELRWAPWIDDPLPPRRGQDPRRRLQLTVANLNRAHRQALLRFVVCSNGQGVGWRFCGAGEGAAKRRRQLGEGRRQPGPG